MIFAPAEGAAAPASGTPNDAAETLVREGIELRKTGQDDAALPKFRKAFELAPTPRAAAQMGLCEQALGRWVKAEEHLTTALAAASDPWVRKHADTLEEALQTTKAHVGRVEVVGSPAGAEVLINGSRVGALPLADAVHVDAGSVDIEVKATGYESLRRVLTVVGGQFQTVGAHLVATASGANATTVPTTSGSPPSDLSADAVATSAGSDEPASGRPVYKRAWFWAAVGVAVAGGVVATLLATRTTETKPAPFDERLVP